VNSREERERLKEEYKEHYRAILESKKKLEQYERKAKIIKALEQIDPKPVFDSLQNALGKLKEKVAHAEARYETWMDDANDANAQVEAEEFSQQQRAKDTIRMLRAEMGSLEEELDRKVSRIERSKTVEPAADSESESGHGRIPDGVTKTIGREKDT
jgi:chromosome segregation ATPase